MADVLCFGNLQLDILCRTITELPPPGGLRMIDAVDFSLSGNGGSLAMALARLGVSVELAGYSGADVIGDQFRIMLSTEGDRKSTRLNSSHGYISYAVFCLKKKKINSKE